MEWIELEATAGLRERVALRLDRCAVDPPLAIVYAHGFGSTQGGEKAELFRARALAKGWAFCSFDFRGHGASSGSMRELTFSRNLADLAAVRARVRESGIERLALFGSSMGGAVALWSAALDPTSLVATAEIAPALGMAAGMERWAGPERLERWRREGEVEFGNALVSTRLGWELMDDLRRYPAEELARRHLVPAILFQGRLDDAVDWRDVADFAARARPGTVDLRLFDDGDHRLLERKELLWRAAAELFESRLGAL